MFQTLKARAGILRLARIPVRLDAQNVQQPLNIQHVRVHRQKFQARRILVNAVGIATTLILFDLVFLKPLSRINIDLPEADKEEEELDPLFIPFVGTTKQVRPAPYRGSDPEWQEFIRFAKDPELGKRVKSELADAVRTGCEKHPVLVMRCGPGMKVRRYWLDIDYPLSPPPTFERSGIEIADDYIAWTTRPVDALAVFQIRKILWPVDTATSFFSYFRAVFSGLYDRTLAAAGIKSPNTPQLTIESLIMKRKELIEQFARERKASEPSETTKDPLTVATTQDASHVGQTGKMEDSAKITPEDLSDMIRNSLTSHFKDPLQVLKEKYLSSMKVTRSYPPRGSVLVGGLVELDCPNAWIVLDVKSAWDPKTKQFHERCTTVALRRLQMKKQPPPGGK